MKYAVIVFFLVLPWAWSKEKILGVRYLKNPFAHIHQNPSRYSQSLTTISCNHPVKILSFPNPKSDIGPGWFKVKVGPYQGYVQKDFLTSKRNVCLQEKFPRFWEKLNLTLSENYYWAKLYDLYVSGRSKVGSE